MKTKVLTALFFLAGFLLNAQAPSLPGQSHPLLVQGEADFNSSDYPAALVSFRRILADPAQSAHHPAADFWLGKTFLVMGDLANAWDHMERFLGRSSGHPLEAEGLYTRGRIFLARGEYEAAIREFHSFLDRFGENSFTPNTLFWIAEGTYLLGRYNQAKGIYERLLSLYPRSQKAEAAGFRLNMVDLKLREEELLNMVQWSHQESVNAFDEYRRKEQAYEKKLKEYEETIQRMKGSDANLARIAELEAQLRTAGSGTGERVSATSSGGGEVREKLLSLKAQALELKALYLEWERAHGM